MRIGYSREISVLFVEFLTRLLYIVLQKKQSKQPHNVYYRKRQHTYNLIEIDEKDAKVSLFYLMYSSSVDGPFKIRLYSHIFPLFFNIFQRIYVGSHSVVSTVIAFHISLLIRRVYVPLTNQKLAFKI